jgi:hypothetical protein
MSTPVRGADGPLGYAPRWARAGAGRADSALDGRGQGATSVQELPAETKPPRIAMPPRETIPPREAAPLREIVSGRDFFSAPEVAPPQEAAFELDAEPVGEAVVHCETRPARTSGAVQTATKESVWKRKKRSTIFEGDAALKELRSRLASAPDQTPEPPLYQAKTPIFASVVRLMGVMVLAAAGALGFLWVTGPHGAPPQIASKAGGSAGGSDVALVSYPPVSYRGLEAPQTPPQAAGDAAAAQTPDVPPSGAAPSSGSPWAVANYNAADGVNAPPVGTPPAGLAPRVPAAPRAPASRVVAPPPAAEPAPAAAPPASLPAKPAPAAAAAPPPPAAPVPASKAPVPAITAPVSVSPPATPSVATRDRDEVAALLVRARTYLAAGDVAAARLVLRRAAERDDPQAALALGGTYDPAVLKRLGIINFHADPAQAREWYRRAAELGSSDAALRLEQLVETDR